VTAIIGVVALFVEALQGLIIVGLDALTTLLMLAGGIVSFPELYTKPEHYIQLERENLLTNYLQ
jgi:hypothetical protein